MATRSRPAGPNAASVRGQSGGIGRKTSPAAEAVSDALRRGAGNYMDHRRRTAALVLSGMGSLAVVAAYQFGLIRRPPELRLWRFDAEAVDASGEAYQYLKTPDAALGLASFATTLVLTGMRREDRATKHPWVPLALAAKVGADAAWGLYLTRGHHLVDSILEDLAAGPFVYRYQPDGEDGFAPGEGAFVPVCWWAVSALASLGRVAEARSRLDQLCSQLPRLVPEEIDPATGVALGNTPLVWSHMEMARALYILDAAERRARWGRAGLWMWRLARYARLRWRV